MEFTNSEVLRKEIENKRQQILPHLDQIEQLRLQNPNREIGGHIINGQLILLEENSLREHSVVHGPYKEVRELGKKGAIFFHTHPEGGIPTESALDILAVYFSLSDVIFSRNGALLLIPRDEIPIEEIAQIDQDAWGLAQKEESFGGEDAYWAWSALIRKRLPVLKIKIIRS